jgi:hypothetical protein
MESEPATKKSWIRLSPGVFGPQHFVIVALLRQVVLGLRLQLRQCLPLFAGVANLLLGLGAMVTTTLFLCN